MKNIFSKVVCFVKGHDIFNGWTTVYGIYDNTGEIPFTDIKAVCNRCGNLVQCKEMALISTEEEGVYKYTMILKSGLQFNGDDDYIEVN